MVQLVLNDVYVIGAAGFWLNRWRAPLTPAPIALGRRAKIEHEGIGRSIRANRLRIATVIDVVVPEETSL